MISCPERIGMPLNPDVAYILLLGIILVCLTKDVWTSKELKNVSIYAIILPLYK